MAKQTKKQVGIVGGLLAMFGLQPGQTKLQPFSFGAMGKNTRPAHIVEFYQKRAMEKRTRRAAKSGASNYAKANVPVAM